MSLFTVCPLKNATSALTNASDFSTPWLSGKMTWFFQPSSRDAGSAYSPVATSVDSFLSVAWVVTANADPPQLTDTGDDASHCGSGADANWPLSAPLPTPAPLR